MFAPAIALALWALAAALGADPAVLRVAGPAITAVASVLHICQELRMFGNRRGRRS